MEYSHIKHTFEPVYDINSEILILGSLPSVKSREQGFYYGHPRNRFWSVLSALLGVGVPVSVEDKKMMLSEGHIAIWDVISECDIEGSSDASIKNVVPNDIGRIIADSGIDRIYANGSMAGSLYRRYIQELTGKNIIILPSTSPANASYSLDELIEKWSIIMEKDCTYCSGKFTP